MKKPVVWFDRSGFGWRDGVANPKWVSRCYHSEEKFCQTALEFLVQRGHRNIAFPLLNKESWVEVRDVALKKVVSELSESLREKIHITTLNCPIEHWDSPVKSGMDEVIQSLKGTSLEKSLFPRLQKFKKRQREIMRHLGDFCPLDSMGSPLEAFYTWVSALRVNKVTDGLKDLRKDASKIIALCSFSEILLHNPRMTAIIGANDGLTQNLILPWLNSLNMKPGRDISLISFDNVTSDLNRILTSTDSAFMQLAFSAVGLITESPMIARKKNGDVVSHPYVVDRGGVDSLKGL